MADCCGDNRFTLIERVKQDFIENTNISDAELGVLDRMCFRMWQLGLLKKYEDIDEDKLDELAKESKQFAVSLASDANLIPSFTSYENGFKAGYRKAKE